MTLEQEIIELVRLSAAESVGDVGFSSPYIVKFTNNKLRFSLFYFSFSFSFHFIFLFFYL